jgi:hypothetical protein
MNPPNADLLVLYFFIGALLFWPEPVVLAGLATHVSVPFFALSHAAIVWYLQFIVAPALSGSTCLCPWRMQPGLTAQRPIT